MWMMLVAFAHADDGPQQGPASLREMRDHEADSLRAVAAYMAGDLAALRAAGLGLAREDPTSGLPPAAVPLLTSIRASGELVAQATDVRATAAPLATMAGTCGSCHALLGVKPVARPTTTRLEGAFLAVALRDQALWTASAGGPEGVTWNRREAQLRTMLFDAAPVGEER